MAVLAAIALGVVLTAIRHVPPGTGRRSRRGRPDVGDDRKSHDRDRTRRRGHRAGLVLFDRYLMAISVIALSVALSEGAATDWLPLLMVDDYEFAATSGAGIYLLFSLCMTVGRLSSSLVLRRWSKLCVLQASTVTGAVGLLGITVVENRWVAIAAIALWGLGASLSFPVALSAVADHGGNAAARVTVVSTAGYLSLLVGPPLLGLVGEHVGLRRAMVVPLIVLIIAALLARRLRSVDEAAVPVGASLPPSVG
jgi:fucose permease